MLSITIPKKLLMRGIAQVSHRGWMERRFLSAWQTDKPMNRDPKSDPTTERLIECIEDEEFAARYPGRIHFISADDTHRERWLSLLFAKVILSRLCIAMDTSC